MPVHGADMMEELIGRLDIYSSGFIFNIAVALIVNSVAIIIFAKRFQAILAQLGQPISSVHSFLITNTVQLAAYVAPLGTGALISKPMMTYFYSKVPVRKTVLAVIFEQIYTLYWDLFLLLSILLFAGGAFFEGVRTVTIAAWLSILGIFTLSMTQYEKALLYIIDKGEGAPRFFRKAMAKFGVSEMKDVESLKQNLRAFLDNGFLIRYSLYIVSVILILPLTLYFTGRCCGVELMYSSAFIGYWSSMILGRLSGLPGGFGVRDVSMGAFLVYLQVPAADAAVITLLNRLVVTFQYVVVGGPLLTRAMRDVAVIELMKRHKG